MAIPFNSTTLQELFIEIEHPVLDQILIHLYKFPLLLPALPRGFLHCKTAVMTLYVSNLDSSVQNTDLKNLFERYGVVKSAHMMPGLKAGTPPEMGVIDMPNDWEARIAIEQLHGSLLLNHHINVYKVNIYEADD